MSPTPLHQPFQAALSVVAAMTVIGLVDSTVILIAEVAGLWQFHFSRATLALPLILGLAWVMGSRIRPRNFNAVAIRSMLIGASMMFYFGALAFMSVPEAAAGLFAAPMLVLLITGVVLREPVSRTNILAAALGFVGVLLVLQPNVQSLSFAQLMPLAGAVFYAFGAITTRRSCAGESTMTLLVGFFVSLWVLGLLGCVTLALVPMGAATGVDGFSTEDFLVRPWEPFTGQFILWTCVQAVGAIVGVALITRGYVLAEAPFVAVFEYSVLIFSAFWGWMLWGQWLNIWAMLGIAIIIGTGAILAQSERS